MKHFTTSDGLNLAYDDIGSGPILLCLAGLTRNMADFDFVVAQFADRARIIRLDTRGRGASDHDPDFRNYNLIRESHDALELMDHLGIDRFAILGTSRGGLIGMALAVSHPERLNGVFLNDIGPMIEPAGLAAIMDYLGNPPPYATIAEAAGKLPAAMAPAFQNVPAATWAAHANRLWRQTDTGLELRYDPKLRTAVIEQSASGATPDLWPWFAALKDLPIGLLRGANSDLLTHETALKMQQERPDMVFAEVPDRGHVPFLDEPDARQAISAFLDKIQARTPS